MEHPCAILRSENQSILSILEVLEEICFLLRADQEILQMDLVSIADFLSRYAEDFHNGKENQLLYPAMEADGLFLNNPEAQVLSKEHDTGKAFINEVNKITAGGAFDKEEFIQHAESYIDHMRQHIQAEETIVLPLAEKKLSATELSRLQKAFDAWEKSEAGTETEHDFQRLINYFRLKFLHNL